MAGKDLKIFTVEIDRRAVLAFEAEGVREANSLLSEAWFRDELAQAQYQGGPLWDRIARLRIRPSSPEEAEIYRATSATAPVSDELMLAFLIDLDETPDGDVEPGAPPPRGR